MAEQGKNHSDKKKYNTNKIKKHCDKTCLQGSEGGFQHCQRNPANVNARKNMFDRYYCIKVSKKSILDLYFDVLFWHYFVLIFLHRRTKIISIYILVPGPSVNNFSIMAENWQEFATWWQSLQNVVAVCHLFLS